MQPTGISLQKEIDQLEKMIGHRKKKNMNIKSLGINI